MATPAFNPELDKRIKEGKELIAAAGCAALMFWSRTDAKRLCPKEHADYVIDDVEMPYRSEWIVQAKKAIELLEKGIAMLEPQTPQP